VIDLPGWTAAEPVAIMDVVLRRVSSATFVGRADELAVLDGALERAQAGTPAFTFVAGESGVGKSRLVAEFDARATRAGARVLIGHGLELGGTAFPYAPVVDALRPVARELADCGVDLELPAGTRGALAELLPEFGHGLPIESFARPAPETPPAAGRATLLFEALLVLLERLGDRAPVALVLEDLHWADPSTRDFLVFLVRSARSERLSLLVTYRSDELHRRHPLRPVLAELERHPAVERIALERFTRDEMDQQVAGILDAPADPALADRVYARGQGNPLYTEELLVASSDGWGELPETLRDALLARFERLPTPAQEVARVAAVVERPMSHALLTELSNLPDDELMAGAREAVAHQLLVTHTDGTYAFRHALVGEAIYEDLLPGERTALHAALAAVLERDPALMQGVPASTVRAELACHWRHAHDLPRSLGASVAAGLAARRVYAHREALRHLERALELWDRVPDAEQRAGMARVDVLRAAAAVAGDAFEAARAVSLQREALAASTDASRLDRARLHYELARYLRYAGEHDESDDALQEALAVLPPEAELERAQLREHNAKNLMLRGHLREAVTEAAAAVKQAHRLGAGRVEAGAMNTEGYSRAALGDLEEGGRLLRASVDLASREGTPSDHVRCVVNLSETLDLSGRTEEALAVVRATLPVIREAGEPLAYGTFLEIQYANELLRVGRTAEADAALPARIPGDLTGPTILFMLDVRARIALTRGNDDEARRSLETLRRQGLGTRDSQWFESVEFTAAELAVREDRLEDARAAAARGLVALEATDDGRRRLKLLWMALLVEAEGAERAGALAEPFDEEPATTLQARLATARGRPGQWAEGPLFAALAGAEVTRIEHALGRTAPDPSVWLAAAAGFDEIGVPWPAAYARLRAAEAHVAAGERSAAAEPLIAARAAAVTIEAHPLVASADALARRARIRVADPEPEADEPAEEVPFGLTPRELEVLLLVAEGRTNRVIGEQLFMSEKTASVHVSRILAKLEVSGRVEAAAVAHRLGLAG
jgi:DNA-binding CsgD family transcriptional regulator/tetratricopeptide (TPR) repeat protein